MPRRAKYQPFSKKDVDTTTYTAVNKDVAGKIKKMGDGRAELKRVDAAVAACATSWASLEFDFTKEIFEER